MSDRLRCTERDGRCTFGVRVQPRASRDAVVGVHEGALKIALRAPPVDGEANAALLAFLAGQLGVPRKALALVRGATGRSKVVSAVGVSAAQLEALLPAG